MTTEPPAPTQAARSSLAWTRTLCATIVFSVIAVRALWPSGQAWLLLLGLCAAGLLVLLLTQPRTASLRASPLPVTAACLLLGLLCAAWVLTG